MYKDEVPQDDIQILGKLREVCYALNREGKYEKVLSSGWKPKDIVNQQAWEQIDEKLQEARKRIREKDLSPVAYFMIKNQMDPKLLSEYTGISRWRVKRHLKAKVFSRLNRKTLKRYANVFGITVEELINFQP